MKSYMTDMAKIFATCIVATVFFAIVVPVLALFTGPDTTKKTVLEFVGMKIGAQK